MTVGELKERLILWEVPDDTPIIVEKDSFGPVEITAAYGMNYTDDGFVICCER